MLAAPGSVRASSVPDLDGSIMPVIRTLCPTCAFRSTPEAAVSRYVSLPLAPLLGVTLVRVNVSGSAPDCRHPVSETLLLAPLLDVSVWPFAGPAAMTSAKQHRLTRHRVAFVPFIRRSLLESKHSRIPLILQTVCQSRPD